MPMCAMLDSFSAGTVCPGGDPVHGLVHGAPDASALVRQLLRRRSVPQVGQEARRLHLRLLRGRLRLVRGPRPPVHQPHRRADHSRRRLALAPAPQPAPLEPVDWRGSFSSRESVGKLALQGCMVDTARKPCAGGHVDCLSPRRRHIPGRDETSRLMFMLLRTLYAPQAGNQAAAGPARTLPWRWRSSGRCKMSLERPLSIISRNSGGRV